MSAARRESIFKTLIVDDELGQATAILISASLATALLLIEASGGTGFVVFYNFIVNLATMAAVIPYAFCALAGVIIRRKHILPSGGTRSSFKLVEIVAFVFAIWTIYGCGAEAVLYGLLLMLLGIPLYVWMRSRGPSSEHLHRRVYLRNGRIEGAR